MQDKTILEVNNIHISYDNGKNDIIKDGSFKVNAGEIVVILGQNGTGKSSILNTILGVRPKAFDFNSKMERDLIFKGEVITDKNIEDFKQSIAYCTQEDDKGRYYMKNVYQNAIDLVKPNLIKNGLLTYEEWEEEVDKVYKGLRCDKVNGNKEFKKLKINECSGGQRKLASLLATMSRTKADLYILDEPLNNLDAYHARKLNNYLVELVRRKDNPPGVLIITHCPIFTNVGRSYEIKNKVIIPSIDKYQTKPCYGNCIVNELYKEEQDDD